MSVGCSASTASHQICRTSASSPLRPPSILPAAICTSSKLSCRGSRMTSAEQPIVQTRNGVKVSVSREDIRIVAPNVDLGSLPEYLKKDCLLFYHPEQKALAHKIAEVSDNIELSEIKWA